MAIVVQLAGAQPVNEHERRVVHAFTERLSDDYYLIPNVEIADRSGQFLDYDLIVAAPHAVYVVETKAWRGQIAGNEREWIVDGAVRSAPIRITAHKSRVLKGWLSDQVPILNQCWVEPAIVLAVRPAGLELSGSAAASCFDIDTFVAFVQDPERLPHPVRRVPELATRVKDVIVGSGKRRDVRAFGSYLVVETLDSDGEWTEFRAVHNLDSEGPRVRLRVVGLSLYSLTPSDRDQRRNRLLREFRALNQMGAHPNIVATTDAFEDDVGNLVLVGPEAPGITLSLMISGGVEESDAEKFSILIQLSNALSHAHSHGVIHRRLSPEHVVLGEDGVVKLGGFGWARITTDGTIHQTTSSVDVNSPFLPPELRTITSYEQLQPAVDLYGLGAIAWALWGGTEPPADPRSLVEGIPQSMPIQLRNAVALLVSAEPGDRVQGFVALRDAAASATPSDPQGTEEVARPPAEYQVGDVIDKRYEVMGILGSGAFSTVYRVHDSVRGHECALKLFGPHFGLDVAQRELRALVNLHHPNIVDVIDVGQTMTSPSQWFLKSELVSGQQLTHFTSAEGDSLTVTEVLNLVDQLLDALQVFHPDSERMDELKSKTELSDSELDEFQRLQSQGLIHRDIKPQNIILTPEGTVKLLDFNIAERAGTAVRTISGTPGYQPPEANLTTWDVSVDLFAVGVVLFELLTHSHPYEGGRPRIDARPRNAHEIRPEVSDELAVVVGKMCAPDRSDRYPSARAARTALRASLIPRATETQHRVLDPNLVLGRIRDWLGSSQPKVELESGNGGGALVQNMPDGFRVHVQAKDDLVVIELEGESREALMAIRESEGTVEPSAVASTRTVSGLRWTLEGASRADTGFLHKTGSVIRDAFLMSVAIVEGLTKESEVPVVDVGDLPSQHYQVGWLTTADLRVPLVVAQNRGDDVKNISPVVLSAVTVGSGFRYAAPNGAYFWDLRGNALSFEAIVTADWEMFGVDEIADAGTRTESSVRLRWGTGLVKGYPNHELEAWIVDRHGSAFVWVSAEKRIRREAQGTSQPVAPIDGSVESFITSRASDASQASLMMQLADSARLLGLVWEIGTSTASRDGFGSYASLRLKDGGRARQIAFLWPATARLDLRLNERWARGRSFVEAGTNSPASAFRVHVRLENADAVTEAEDLIKTALQEVGGNVPRLGTNRQRILATIRSEPGLTDSQLVARSGVRPHQQVNQICRALEKEGLLERRVGPNGTIENHPID